MVVWTISAEAGTGCDQVASDLATAAGVPLFDRSALALLAAELDPELIGSQRIDDLEECVGGGGLTLMALGVPFSPVAADVVRRLQLHHSLPALGRVVAASAARQCCVLAAPGAFAALGDHPAAVHVRLRAPFDWRVAAFARASLTSRRAAEKAVRHDDQLKHAWLRSLYHLAIDDPGNYALVLDASRLGPDRLVETMLAAGGVAAAAAAPSGQRDTLDSLPGSRLGA
ncbi:MAG: cytidylate kinase family protein [Gaiellales bacterium]